MGTPKGWTWPEDMRAAWVARQDSPLTKIMDRIEYDTNGGCWLWTGTIIPGTGYGQIQISARAISAHRLSWEVFKGDEPGLLCVCHRCDVRACVNPDHLFLGTHAENAQDMRAKGRGVRGEHQWSAKLTPEDIPKIRRLRETGMLQKDIGAMFGVSQVKISQILLGKAWTHIAAERGITLSDGAGA